MRVQEKACFGWRDGEGGFDRPTSVAFVRNKAEWVVSGYVQS